MPKKAKPCGICKNPVGRRRTGEAVVDPDHSGPKVTVADLVLCCADCVEAAKETCRAVLDENFEYGRTLRSMIRIARERRALEATTQTR